MAERAHNLLNDYHLLQYDVVDSTNEEAKRLAGGGASHGAVIWAKRQTMGRGRMGREWISPEGNFYVSLLLSPPCELEKASQLSFVAAVAAADTLKQMIGEEGTIACKWPNDILYNGKKLGGILLESFNTAEDKQWVVVGVGINIDSYPEHVIFPATCVKEAGVEIISAKIVLSRFVYHFIARYDQWCERGFKDIRKAWLADAHRLKQKAEVVVGNQKLQGTFDSIDEAGRLQLKQADGTIRAISAGDVFFL